MSLSFDLFQNQFEAAIKDLAGTLSHREATRAIVGITFLRLLSKHVSFANETLPDGIEGIFDWQNIKRSTSSYELLIEALQQLEHHLKIESIGRTFKRLGLLNTIEQASLGQKVVSCADSISVEDLSDVLHGQAATLLLIRLVGTFNRQGVDVFSPQSLGKLVVKLLDPKPGESIYDPACGIANFLISTKDHLNKENSNSKYRIIGQEIDEDVAALARLHLFFHDFSPGNILSGDSLLSPPGKKFDIVLSSPPSGVHYEESRVLEISRLRNDFKWDNVHSSVEINFLQHSIASLENAGRAAIIVSNSFLSGEGEEKIFRKNLAKQDLIEAIISPPKGLAGTLSTSPNILILNSNKPKEKQGFVRFIYGQAIVDSSTSQFLSDQAQSKLIDAFRSNDNERNFAATISYSDVENHNYIMMPSWYLDFNKVDVFLGNEANFVYLEQIAKVFGSSPLPDDDITVQKHDLTRQYTMVDDILLQNSTAEIISEAAAGELLPSFSYVIRLKPDFQKYVRYLAIILNSKIGLSHLFNIVWFEYTPDLRLRSLHKLQVPLPGDSLLDLINKLIISEQTLLGYLQNTQLLRDNLFSIKDEHKFNSQIRQLSTGAEVLSQSIVQVDDLTFQIRNFYPFILAYPYRLLDMYQNPMLLYKEQLRVGENLLAFLGSVGLAFATWTGDVSNNRSEFSYDKLLNYWKGGISPGDWLRLGRSCAKLLQNNHKFAAIDSFVALWFKGRGQGASKFSITLDRLVKLKNDFKHDRGPKTENDYEVCVQEMQSILVYCYENLRFFVQYPIRMILSVDVHWHSQNAILETLNYTGDHPGLRQERCVVQKALPKNHLFLEITDEVWVPLYPLVCVEYCSACQTRETYLCDSWNGQHALLKSYERGHTHERGEIAERVGEDLNVWLNKIFFPAYSSS